MGPGLPAWPRHDPKKDVIFGSRPMGLLAQGPNPGETRLDVMQLNTEAGKGSDFKARRRSA
jgi:para-nitrobenzyl esterase